MQDHILMLHLDNLPGWQIYFVNIILVGRALGPRHTVHGKRLPDGGLQSKQPSGHTGGTRSIGTPDLLAFEKF